MPRSRRAVLLTGCGLIAGLAGCSLEPPHADQIRIKNAREARVRASVRATPLAGGPVVVETTFTLAAGAVAYVADPVEEGSEASPVRVEVRTADGLEAAREWAPGNLAQQLKIIIEADRISWDVGAPE
ncbi:MAG: hypothetical protein ABEJ35_02625 [Halobacteriaceae archaeon]